MPIKSLFLVLAVVVVTAAAPIDRSHDVARAQSGAWIIDASRSEARFIVTKFGFADVTGVFRQSEGEIQYDADHPETSRVQWRIRVASVRTDASDRDSALQRPEYFDAVRHPYLEFASRSVRRLDDGRLEVSGLLTMRGVTRPLVTLVRHLPAGAYPSFETAFEVDRYDFGIVGGSVMRRLIGRTVRVRLVAVVNPQ